LVWDCGSQWQLELLYLSYVLDERKWDMMPPQGGEQKENADMYQ
jgi:hypothetical protein